MRQVAIAAIAVMLGSPGCSGRRERDAPLAELAAACSHDAELGCPRPILPVRDLGASLRYYREALGFHVDWEYGEPPDFASVSRGDAVLFLAQGGQGHAGTWVWVAARDVDRLHQELIRRRAIIEAPPADKPWGAREMQVADLDGNVLRIGGRIRD